MKVNFDSILKRVQMNSPHLDADTQMFYAREIEYIMAKTYDMLYPELKARSLFPINREVPPGAKTFTYYQYDMRGMGKLIANYAKDFPRADINKKVFTGVIREIGASYGYSWKDLEAAKMAGLPLEQRKANAAKRAVLQKENKVAFNGDADSNILGLLSVSSNNVSEITVASDGTGASPTLLSKTPTQIIRDLNLLFTKVYDVSLGVETADTLILPPEQYSYIASTPYSTITTMTILQWFMNNNPWVKNVEMVPELKGAGPGSSDIMFAYKRDPDKVAIIVSLDFMQLPPQLEGAEWVIPCMSGTGGLVFFYPLSAAYGHGI